MNKWMKWGLWGVGGLAGLWIIYRAFFKPPDVEVVEEDIPVPLLTPSLGPGAPAGVSNFPSAPGSAATFTAMDLIKLQRTYDIEDRTYGASTRLTEQQRRDAAILARQQRADKQAADRLAQRTSGRQRDKLQNLWDEVNLDRIKKGLDPLSVCITKRGSYGVGKQCKGAQTFAGE